MKKNFMAIASLLIAAMLLVVSCAPEANVEGKVEDGLVEAVIGLGRSAKDITIANKDNAVASIIYKYSLQPAWSSNNTGAPIYGAVSDEEDKMKVIDGSFGIAASVPNTISLGKVTPGLWNIHVIGYNNGKKVLEGKASKYFNGTDGEKAIVFVAPVSTNEDVNVTITLKMQDLGLDDYNKIGYSFTNLNGTNINGSSVTSGDNPMTPSSEAASLENVKVYTRDVTVKSGFNTVTFSLPGYDGGKGGITKTFLAIPGVPVSISGSVTPAEFKEGNADIKVLSIDGGKVTVAEAPGSAAVVDEVVTIKPAGEGTDAVTVTVKKLANGGTYTFEYDGSPADDTINATVGVNATRSYQWYVGEKKITNATGSKYNFTETVAGDYNVTCVATVSFTKDGQDYELQTSATMPYVRVLEAPAQSGTTTGTEEGGSSAEGQ